MKEPIQEYSQSRRLEELLGSGTYGQVYRETNRELDQIHTAAAKILRLPGPQLPLEALTKDCPADTPQDRWLHRIVSDCSHRYHAIKAMRGQGNVAFVEEVKTTKSEDGYLIYVRTEWLTPLEEYLAKHAPTEEMTRRFCQQIATAVGQFEKAGFLHRNIKPSNLMVNAEGDFKLCDVGLPKLGLSESPFTAPGACEKPAGSVSDELYAIGAVALALFRPEGRLLSVCRKACHPDPAQRYTTVEQFLRALTPQRATVAPPSVTPPAPTPRRLLPVTPKGWTLFGLTALAIVTCLVLFVRLSILFATNVDPSLPTQNQEHTLSLVANPDGSLQMIDLSSLELSQAKELLERYGIAVQIAYDHNPQAKNRVLGQSVAAGQALLKGDTLWLLSGCESKEQATQRIRAITLSTTAVTLTKEEQYQPTLTLTGNDGAQNLLTWTSSDPAIVAVNGDTLLALEAGTATLTVTDRTGLATATLKVTVKPQPLKVPNVVGMTESVAEEYLQRMGYSARIQYQYSSKEQYSVIAQSPAAGESLTPGSQVILTVSLGKESSNQVPVTGVTLSHTTLQLNGGQTFRLEATVLPTNAGNKAVSWLSSDRSVATVNSNGEVTALADGTAVIRVITAHGSKEATCTVTVKTATYTIVYDANGGSGTMEPSTHVYGVEKPLNDNTFTRIGYSFSGWSTDPVATEPAFANLQTVINVSETDGDVVRLYAIWSPMEYSLRYDPCGGTVDSDSIQVVFGKPIGPLAVPQREGYVFDGWFSNRENGIRITAETVINADSPSTLYAHWIRLSAPVRVDQLPEGAQIAENTRYWTYTGTVTKTTTQKVSTPGWELIDQKNNWFTEEKTLRTVDYPAGFDSSHPLYSLYVASAPKETDTDTYRVSYLSQTTVSYLYWHWYSADTQGLASQSTVIYNRFNAFEDHTVLPQAAPDGSTQPDAFYLPDRDACPWWYALPVVELRYQVEEYTQVYTYRVIQTLSSTTRPTGQVSDLQEWVQYYLYE